MAAKCTKPKNARAKRAKITISLITQICDVVVSVFVMAAKGLFILRGQDLSNDLIYAISLG